jgi:hypothetical protein
LSTTLVATAVLATSVAQSAPSQPPQASSKPHAKTHAAAPSAREGTFQDGVYRNPFFGFSCKPPYGWVDRTSDMSSDAEAGKSMVLLSVFERPPEATGESVNSAIVIAAESAASYPGLKTPADYFGPLTEVTTSKGFKVIEEPYESTVGGKVLARSDFSKEVSGTTLYQASLVAMQKGYVLSFTFLGNTKDEVDTLIEGLTFSTSSTHPKPAK